MWGWMVLVLILTQAWANEGADGDELPAHKRQSVQYSTLVGPSFINTSQHEHAHAPIGQTAYLNCVVRNLHNFTVSWVRARDIHLLTAGETTYTSDKRFVAVNPGGGEQWMLKLHHAQPSDAGTYLCQVSVSPPMSTAVTLLVTEPVANVHPGTDVYLKAGSRVVLVCEVSGCPYPAIPAWYKGHQLQDGIEIEEGRVQATSPIPSTTSSSQAPSTSLPPTEDSFSNLNRHGHRGYNSQHGKPESSVPFKHPFPGRSDNTSHPRYPGSPPGSNSPNAPESGSPRSVLPTTTTVMTTTPTPVGLPIAKATLIRPKASSAHSGVYTCTNACTDPVNLTLHVLTGDEETAAMQHPSGSSGLLAINVRVIGVIHLLSVILTATSSKFLS